MMLRVLPGISALLVAAVPKTFFWSAALLSALACLFAVSGIRLVNTVDSLTLMVIALAADFAERFIDQRSNTTIAQVSARQSVRQNFTVPVWLPFSLAARQLYIELPVHLKRAIDLGSENDAERLDQCQQIILVSAASGVCEIRGRQAVGRTPVILPCSEILSLTAESWNTFSSETSRYMDVKIRSGDLHKAICFVDTPSSDAPNITEAILGGHQPVALTLDRLLSVMPLPLAWEEQRKLLGL